MRRQHWICDAHRSPPAISLPSIRGPALSCARASDWRLFPGLQCPVNARAAVAALATKRSMAPFSVARSASRMSTPHHWLILLVLRSAWPRLQATLPQAPGPAASQQAGRRAGPLERASAPNRDARSTAGPARDHPPMPAGGGRSRGGRSPGWSCSPDRRRRAMACEREERP